MKIEINPLIEKTINSDHTWFTQGLAWSAPNTLWHISGAIEESLIIKKDLTHQSTDSWPLPNVFAEGCTRWKEWLLVLTWRSFAILVIDPHNGREVTRLEIGTEGWGLTSSEGGLIYSDGSSTLRWIDEELLFRQINEQRLTPFQESSEVVQIIKELNVKQNQQALFQLNELEWVEDFILANIYPTPKIAVIESKTGQVVAILDLTSLVNTHEQSLNRENGVSNGIAYDAANDTLWFTGKRWHALYGVRASSLLSTLRSR